MRNKKVMRFEIRRGPKRKNSKKNAFCKLKSLFFILLFFITPFPLHFKERFEGSALITF